MDMERCLFQVNGLEISAAFPTADRDDIYLPLLRRLTALQRERGRRIAVFLAAPPAAGKSTLCRYLELLSRREAGLSPVQCVGIDGFHYTNAYLEGHSIVRDGVSIPLRRIKGAPETYDVARLGALLETLDQPGQLWPEYDRRIHDPIDGAIEIRADIVVVEGNWLLLDEAPWSALKCDYSVFIRAGDPAQLERIVARKMMGGFSEAAAREFVKNNDWPNILFCMAHSRRADLNLRPGSNGRMEVIL